MKIRRTYFAAAILLASPAYAQTCTLTPSCEDLGYTMNSEQCNSGSSLKCPFDETKLFCYQETDNGGSITLLVENKSSSAQDMEITMCGGYLKVDCGNGEIKEAIHGQCVGNNKGTVTCTYKKKGTYTLKITGWARSINFSYGASSSTMIIKNIKSLDIRNVQVINNICDRYTTGTIPNLPPDLTGVPLSTSVYDFNSMFDNCQSLTGPIPPLPRKLLNGDSMFRRCFGLTGPVPELPPYLVRADSMFEETGLTGSIPKLPDFLEYGGSMFAYCSGLSGQAPAKPKSLKGYSQIFRDTGVTLTSDWPSDAK